MSKIKVLFLCGANSCRSQMAEGWARALGGDRLEAYSAGRMATGVNPGALAAMKERGVDITGQWSKTTAEVPVGELDYIVTLCAEGAEYCPTVPGPAKRFHWPIEDPVKVQGPEGPSAFRRVRDEVESRMKDFLRSLP